MSIKQQIDADLKAAMLGGDKTLVTTLRGLKSAILYAEVADNKRDTGLTDDETIALLGKEAKKRQESADLYVQGGRQETADAELAEKRAIEKYLPAQLGDDELRGLVAAAVAETGASGPQAMGQVIGLVKQRAGASAEGSRIAAITKEVLNA
jgi:uncharacterized protein YqeY